MITFSESLFKVCQVTQVLPACTVLNLLMYVGRCILGPYGVYIGSSCGAYVEVGNSSYIGGLSGAYQLCSKFIRFILGSSYMVLILDLVWQHYGSIFSTYYGQNICVYFGDTFGASGRRKYRCVINMIQRLILCILCDDKNIYDFIAVNIILLFIAQRRHIFLHMNL